MSTVDKLLIGWFGSLLLIAAIFARIWGCLAV